jgi:hypothetical protein
MLAAMSEPHCGREEHEAIKADPVRWWTETEFLGHQDSETEDGDEAIAELALCRRCGSTLALEIDLVPVEVAQ